MTLPVRPVSTDVLARVSAAIDQMTSKPDLPRTKRTIERLAGLSHDVVARAFRQDAELGTDQRLNERFTDLTQAHGRQSPHQVELRAAEQRLAERGTRIADLEHDVAAMAQVILAQHRLLEDGKPDPVVRLDRQRRRKS